MRLPGRCLVCGLWQNKALCSSCRSCFAAPIVRCQRCALALPMPPSAVSAAAPALAGGLCGGCLADPPAFSHAVAVADYGFPWDRLIALFKFQQQPELAGTLAGLLVQVVAAAHLPPVAAVLPVPLAPARLAERGYNQSWELARRAAAQLGLPAWPQVLERWRDAPHQVGASRAQRLANLQGGMWVDLPQQARVAGQHLALVDDVLTTGITAQAATQALLAAGAASVQVWVLARTPAPGA